MDRATLGDLSRTYRSILEETHESDPTRSLVDAISVLVPTPSTSAYPKMVR
jgi:hypothetical protein